MSNNYSELYTLPRHELGFYDTKKDYFKRNIQLKNIDKLLGFIERCNKNKRDAFITNFGYYQYNKNNNLDNAFIDKIFFDLDGNNIEKVEKETYKFNKQLEDYFQCKNVIIQSGNKGYHIYLFLEEPRIVSQAVVRSLMQWIHKKFKPKYLDENVINNPKRLIRLPGSINHKSGNKCTILTSKIVPSPYINVCINRQERIVKQEEKILETKLKLKQQRAKIRQLQNNNDNEIHNWAVMKQIFESLYPEGTTSGNGKYITLCPYHSDTHPSAFYTDTNFYCSSCNLNVGVWKLLTELEKMPAEEALSLIKRFQ